MALNEVIARAHETPDILLAGTRHAAGRGVEQIAPSVFLRSLREAPRHLKVAIRDVVGRRRIGMTRVARIARPLSSRRCGLRVTLSRDVRELIQNRSGRPVPIVGLRGGELNLRRTARACFVRGGGAATVRPRLTCESSSGGETRGTTTHGGGVCRSCGDAGQLWVISRDVDSVSFAQGHPLDHRLACLGMLGQEPDTPHQDIR